MSGVRGERIAFYPAGGSGTASSRLRAWLPCRALGRAGQPVEIFDPARVDRYAGVLFQKRYTAESLELARTLRRRGVRVAFDLCDNHFHYRLEDPAASAERSRRLAAMITEADLVTVSTPALAEVVRERTGRVSTVIDDWVEMGPWQRVYRLWGRLARLGEPGRSRALRLVWFGVAGMERPPFGLVDLARILPAIEALSGALPLRLTVISNSRTAAADRLAGTSLKSTYREWSLRRFAFDLAPHDIALVPVNRNPLTLCKTANRPVLALLLGVPVAVEPIPSYQELEGVLEVGDWQRDVGAYAADPERRRRDVRRGVEFVRRRFASRRIAAQWQEALRELLG